MENSAHGGNLFFRRGLVQARCNFDAKSKAGFEKVLSLKGKKVSQGEALRPA
jgi:hypothetical protein